MLESMKPMLRAVKYAHLRRQAARAARRPGPHDAVPAPAPIAWVIGCGRSGTTLIGRMLTLHPDVEYLYEPYHFWVAIDRETDFINFHHRVDGRCLMDASHCTEETRRRFARLMMGTLRRSGRRLLVEKTPINTLRIGYLEHLAPGARFVNVVRDGVDVCRSIARLAATNTYRIAGRPDFNQWWGQGGVKWPTLLRDGTAAGYFPGEAEGLAGDLERGAYEWLVSLGEVDRRRAELGDRLCEITYEDLARRTEETLERLRGFLGLTPAETWIEEAAATLTSFRRNEGEPVRLPEAMCREFNALQERFGFEGRAQRL